MNGREPVRTPNLGRLASEGVWYRQTYSTSPLCMPARASLHNGLYAHRTGFDHNVGHWPFGIPMLPNVLRGLGYRTAAIGKLHVFGTTRPWSRSSTRRLGACSRCWTNGDSPAIRW
jgi:arylsulfatase A-like enzyme